MVMTAVSSQCVVMHHLLQWGLEIKVSKVKYSVENVLLGNWGTGIAETLSVRHPPEVQVVT